MDTILDTMQDLLDLESTLEDDEQIDLTDTELYSCGMIPAVAINPIEYTI